MSFIVTGGYWEDQGYWETYSSPAFDAGARTVAELTDDGFFIFSVGQATGIVCGLNDQDSGAEATEIIHGFYLETGLVRIVERGVFKTSFVSYTPVTSVFRVDRTNGVVRYYKDNVLLYTSLTHSTGTVFLDCSLYAANDTIELIGCLNTEDALTDGGSFTFPSGKTPAILGMSPFSQIDKFDYASIKYAIITSENGTARIYEYGFSKHTFTIPDDRSIFSIKQSIEDGTVTYYVDDALVYTSVSKYTGTVYKIIQDTPTIINNNDNGNIVISGSQERPIVHGLSSLENNSDVATINFGFYVHESSAQIIENGAIKTSPIIVPDNSTLQIKRESGVIKYYVASVLVYTSNSLYTGTLYESVSYEILVLFIEISKPALYFEECISLEILLPNPAVILLETDGQLIFDLSKPVFYLEESLSLSISLHKPELEIIADENLFITLPKPELLVWDEDVSTLIFSLPKPDIYIRESLIVPDYSILQFSIPQPRITLNEEENLSLDLLIPPPIIGLSDGYEYCHIELPQPSLGMTPAIMNFGILEWPQWNFTLIGGDSLSTLAWALHTVSSGGTSCVFLHRTSYQGSDRQEAILLHETSVSGMKGQALHATTYQSGSRTHAQAVNEAIYGTFGLSPTLATHSVLWSSASLAPSFSVHQAHWASTGFSTQLALHDALWSSRILTSTETLHTSEWASIGLSAQFTLHTSVWDSSGGVTQQLAVHEVLWSSRILTPSFTLHESTFASIGLSNVFAAHASEWQSVGGLSQVFGLHESLWSSRILTSTHTLHSSTWASIGRDFIASLNDVSWSSVGSLSTQFTVHTSEWSTAGGSTQQIALHDALWSSRILTPSLNLHESTWTSSGLQVTMASHQVDWSSVGANVPSLNLHQASWASPGTSSFVFSAHDTSWSVQATLLNTHEQRWKSVIETSMIHHSAYETVDNTFALQLHRLLWRSNQTAPIINTGLIYARI